MEIESRLWYANRHMGMYPCEMFVYSDGALCERRASMSKKRRDKKNRILHTGKASGRMGSICTAMWILMERPNVFIAGV